MVCPLPGALRVVESRDGEAEADVPGCALGQRRRENTFAYVVVVVHLCGHLAGVGAKDAAGVLHEPALEGDRCAEKQSVEHRAVEPLRDKRSGGDDQQWCVRPRLFQLRECCGALLCAHASAQHDRSVAPLDECRSQPFEVTGPLRQHQAVSSALSSLEDVLDDLLKPVVVTDEVAVDRGHTPGRLRAGVAVVGIAGGMHKQDRVRDRRVDGGEGVSRRPRDRVPDRSDLQGDEVVDLVPSIGRLPTPFTVVKEGLGIEAA